MEKQVSFTHDSIVIGGKEYPLYCGSFQYWRSDSDYWPVILDKIKNLGLTMIETYIPWGVHELRKGEYDFGSQDKQKNLKKFLSLCKEKKFFVFLRPGPHINSELNCFGFPERIVFTPEYMARTPMGTPVVYPYATKPFPIPSYASPDFMSEVFQYFDEVYEQIKEYIFPNGPVVSLQVDNEYCFFFRDRAYTLDYSKANIILYHKFLRKTYRHIDRLNSQYHTSYIQFEDIMPPAGFSPTDLRKCYDWVLFKEDNVIETLRRIATYWHEKDLAIPLFHNIAYQYYTPVNLIELEKNVVDLAGMDMYLYPNQSREIRRKAKYLAGCSRLAFVPEFLCGVWFDNPDPPTVQEQEFLTLYTFMHGVKAINLYMLVERDRWFGCPITVDGRTREDYSHLYYELLTFLKRIKFWKLQRQVSVALVKNYELGRFQALYSLADFSSFKSNAFVNGLEIPSNLFRPKPCLGLSWEKLSRNHWSEEPWLEKLEDQLSLQGIDYDILDTNCSLPQLEKYSVIYISGFERMSEQLQYKIVELMKTHPCVIINQIPEQDLEGNSCAVLSDYIIYHPPQDPKFTKYFCQNTPNLEWVEYQGEETRYLFVANTSDTVTSGVICANRSVQEKPIWGTGILLKDSRGLSMTLSPHSVSVWEVRE